MTEIVTNAEPDDLVRPVPSPTEWHQWLHGDRFAGAASTTAGKIAETTLDAAVRVGRISEQEAQFVWAMYSGEGGWTITNWGRYHDIIKKIKEGGK